MNRLVFIMFFVLVTCCSIQKTREVELERIIVSNIDVDNFIGNASVLLIIPNAGCKGCISNSEAFVIDNLSKYSNLRVVFTGIKSKKTLKLRIGEDLYSHRRVLIDEKNVFASPTLISVYPVSVLFDKRKVVLVDDLSPSNPDAIYSLVDYLSE